MITVQVPKGFSSGEVLLNSDGWIPWNGGECPVPLDTKVEVSCRGPYPTSTGLARDFSWGHLEMLYDTDIVSYRVIKEESKDEGWIPWNGGRCPVPEDTLVEVKLREEVMKDRAIRFGWRYEEEFPESDIVAYRVIKNEPEGDGWIPWTGGGQPVPDGTKVEVEGRDGGTDISDAKYINWQWDKDDPETDILSYRVLPQYNPEDVAFKDKAPPPRDTQVGGTHYAEMKIQPWDAINVWSTPEMVLGYHINTSVSYLARFRAKGGLQDIKKAHHHLSELIRYFEEEEEYPF